jgi:hypothetical protein
MDGAFVLEAQAEDESLHHGPSAVKAICPSVGPLDGIPDLREICSLSKKRGGTGGTGGTV